METFAVNKCMASPACAGAAASALQALRLDFFGRGVMPMNPGPCPPPAPGPGTAVRSLQPREEQSGARFPDTLAGG